MQLYESRNVRLELLKLSKSEIIPTFSEQEEETDRFSGEINP
jgi:hypothetical protein